MVTAILPKKELPGIGPTAGHARALTVFKGQREKCFRGAVGIVQVSAACFAISLKAAPTWSSAPFPSILMAPW